MIIPRLLEDLQHTLPVANCWLEYPEPLPILMPNMVEERRQIPRELVALPELEKKPPVSKKTVEIETTSNYQNLESDKE